MPIRRLVSAQASSANAAELFPVEAASHEIEDTRLPDALVPVDSSGLVSGPQPAMQAAPSSPADHSATSSPVRLPAGARTPPTPLIACHRRDLASQRTNAADLNSSPSASRRNAAGGTRTPPARDAAGSDDATRSPPPLPHRARRARSRITAEYFADAADGADAARRIELEAPPLASPADRGATSAPGPPGTGPAGAPPTPPAAGGASANKRLRAEAAAAPAATQDAAARMATSDSPLLPVGSPSDVARQSPAGLSPGGQRVASSLLQLQAVERHRVALSARRRLGEAPAEPSQDPVALAAAARVARAIRAGATQLRVSQTPDSPPAPGSARAAVDAAAMAGGVAALPAEQPSQRPPSPARSTASSASSSTAPSRRSAFSRSRATRRAALATVMAGSARGPGPGRAPVQLAESPGARLRSAQPAELGDTASDAASLASSSSSRSSVQRRSHLPPSIAANAARVRGYAKPGDAASPRHPPRAAAAPSPPVRAGAVPARVYGHASGTPLPAALIRLAKTADALDSALVIVRKRSRSGPVLVSPTIRTVVESMTGRRFTPAVLATIAALDPTRYALRQRRVASAAAAEPTGRAASSSKQSSTPSLDGGRLTWTLTIDLAEPASASAASAPSAAPSSSSSPASMRGRQQVPDVRVVTSLSERRIAERRRSFRDALVAHVRAAHTAFLVGRAAEGQSTSIPRGAVFHPEFDLEAVAPPAPAALPRPPTSSQRVRVGDVLDGSAGGRSRPSSTLRFGLEAAATASCGLSGVPTSPDGALSGAPRSRSGQPEGPADGLERRVPPARGSAGRAGAWTGVEARSDDASLTPTRPQDSAGPADDGGDAGAPAAVEEHPPQAPSASPPAPALAAPPPDAASPPASSAAAARSLMPPPMLPEAHAARARGDLAASAVHLAGRYSPEEVAAPADRSAGQSSAMQQLLAHPALRALGVTATDLPPGVTGLPATLVASVIRRQRAAERREDPETRRRDVARRQIVALPALFDAVVGVLMAHRRPAMYLTDLVTAVLQNPGISLSKQEVVAGIREIARRAPEYCSIKPLSAGEVFKRKMRGDAAAARRAMLDVSL